MKRDMTRPQQQAMFAKLNAGRTQGAINRDLSVRAAETLPNTPENVKLWRQDQRRIDIEGIDTPIIRKLPEKSKPLPKWNKTDDSNVFPNEELDLKGKIYHNEFLELPYNAQIVGKTKGEFVRKEFKYKKDAVTFIENYTPPVKHMKADDESSTPHAVTYSDWEHHIAETTTPSDIEKKINLLDANRDKLTKSHLNAIERSTSMQSNSQARAQTRNAMVGNYEELQAYKNAQEIQQKNKYKKVKGAPSTPTEFKADASLLNKELLRNAHSGTSFDPEKRAETEKEYFIIEVNDVYKELKPHAKTDKQKSELKDEMLKFQKKYAEKFNDTLTSRGRLLSPMITGPANFPTRRNEKAYSSYENKVRENTKFRDKVVAGITKRWRKENVEDAGGERAVLENKLKKQEQSHQQMKDINVIMRKKTSEDEKRTQLKKIGVEDSLIQDVFKPDYMGRTGFQGFHLQNSNAKIKSMKERLKTMKKQEATETTLKKINGVEIVDNKEADRVQILFDGKPDEAMRKKLKGSGWRWSPKNTAWQRKRTDNAMRSAEQIVKGD